MTGAASGIGQATALRLATESAAVIGCDVNAAGLEGTLARITAAGGDATGVTADIAQQAEVDRLVEETTARHGKDDVLANVAGIMDSFLPAHEVEDETWHRVLAVNLDGPMLLCRKVLPGMMQRRSGAIVNVASVGGLEGGAAGVAYTVSKHALIGLARSIALDLPDRGDPLQRGLPWWDGDQHRHPQPVGLRTAREGPGARRADGLARRDRRAAVVACLRGGRQRQRRDRHRRRWLDCWLSGPVAG